MQGGALFLRGGLFIFTTQLLAEWLFGYSGVEFTLALCFGWVAATQLCTGDVAMRIAVGLVVSVTSFYLMY